MVEFVSTRNINIKADAREAIVNGLSPDGGLYAPTEFPKVDYAQLTELSYTAIAQRILRAWFSTISYDDIDECCRDAYTHFDTPLVAPVVNVGSTYVTELFHGETCAFKDVALSLLPRILVKAKNSLGITDKILILTATSGDTGSAAMNGFRDVPDTGIITFFPNGGVSCIQRKQMVSMPGNNLTACAINGNFDACQTAVKNAFATLPAPGGVRFSSANSINIARLVPQITYYYTSYIDLIKRGAVKPGGTVNFVVPTGNFGDILAGWYAKQMGLPIGKLICASNANNVLTDFINTGIYDKRRTFMRTYSPSMDILISSNLERLLYHTEGHEATARHMAELKTNGYYKISDSALRKIQQDFVSYCYDDAMTLSTIKQVFDETRYLADPHTAVALASEAAFRAANPDSVNVVLSTASPFKFPECAFEALGLQKTANPFEMLSILSEYAGVSAPKYLTAVEHNAELHTDIIEQSDINNYILAKHSDLLK